MIDTPAGAAFLRAMRLERFIAALELVAALDVARTMAAALPGPLPEMVRARIAHAELTYVNATRLADL